jgi:hypothetical protein
MDLPGYIKGQTFLTIRASANFSRRAVLHRASNIENFIKLLHFTSPHPFEDTTVTDSRDSSVDIAMGYGLDGRGSIPSRGKRF